MKNVHVYFVLVTFLFILVAPIEARWTLDSKGNVINQSFGQVLGDEDYEKEEDQDEKDEDSSESDKSSEDQREDEKENEQEDSSDDTSETKFESETYDPTTKTKVKTEIRGGETHVEVKYDDGREYTYEGKDENGKVEEQAEFKQKNGEKVKFEYRNGKLVFKSESSSGGEQELGEDNEFEIDDHENEDSIRVSTSSGDKILFARGKHAAKTNFPLSVNTETNQLVVTTPRGEKVVTILPNAAISNMLAQNAFDRLGATPIADASTSAQLAGLEGIVELTEDDEGSLVYEIEGISDQKLFGFAQVEIKRKIKVSAETGELLGTQVSLFDRLKDVFSF